MNWMEVILHGQHACQAAQLAQPYLAHGWAGKLAALTRELLRH